MSNPLFLDENSDFTPCPGCGYDLRGRPDDTRCPECGRSVRISAAFAEINRWADRRLLDLWSVGVLQTVGSICVALSLLAISQGQYVALILGLTAGLYVSAATAWFGWLTIVILRRIRSPFFQMLGKTRRRQLIRWAALDAALVIVPPVFIMILRPA